MEVRCLGKKEGKKAVVGLLSGALMHELLSAPENNGEKLQLLPSFLLIC